MDHPRPGLRYVDANDLDRSTFDFDGIDVVDPAGEKLGEVDGFIIDVNEGRPYHVVVEAGHWFKHKHFLLPIGHVSLDSGSRRLKADVAKARAERFPGFSRGEFDKLTDKDLDQMAYSSASACSDDAIDQTIGWASWTHYEYPSWWDASYYRTQQSGASRGANASSGGAMSGASASGTSMGAGSAGMGSSGARGSSAGASSAANTTATSGSSSTAAARDRDRDLVTAHGGETSPHAGGRAQPGDVIGVETGGEQTHVGDTADDEDKRRRDAERSAAKSRD